MIDPAGQSEARATSTPGLCHPVENECLRGRATLPTFRHQAAIAGWMPRASSSFFTIPLGRSARSTAPAPAPMGACGNVWLASPEARLWVKRSSRQSGKSLWEMQCRRKLVNHTVPSSVGGRNQVAEYDLIIPRVSCIDPGSLRLRRLRLGAILKHLFALAGSGRG